MGSATMVSGIVISIFHHLLKLSLAYQSVQELSPRTVPGLRYGQKFEKWSIVGSLRYMEHAQAHRHIT